MRDKDLPENRSRRRLRRAACLAQAFRDVLIPEMAGKIAPFGRLLDGAAEALDWACPPPTGELTDEQRAGIENARTIVESLLSIARTNPNDYAPVELVLAEISESLSNAG